MQRRRNLCIVDELACFAHPSRFRSLRGPPSTTAHRSTCESDSTPVFDGVRRRGFRTIALCRHWGECCALSAEQAKARPDDRTIPAQHLLDMHRGPSSAATSWSISRCQIGFHRSCTLERCGHAAVHPGHGDGVGGLGCIPGGCAELRGQRCGERHVRRGVRPARGPGAACRAHGRFDGNRYANPLRRRGRQDGLVRSDTFG